MRTRVWCMSLVLASLGVACGDQPTEVVPEREMTQGAGTIAAATATSEGGLSITTDKDDYAPGDTVWFTGAGWQSYDTLDIQLVDEPLTHPPHTWWVPIAADGTFRDSTYVVDLEDFGVTFTLTATSRLDSTFTLTVQFTDGNLSLPFPATNPGFQSVPFSPPVSTNLSFTAAVSLTPAGNPSPDGTHNNVRIRIRSAGNLSPAPPTLWRELTIGNLSNGQTGSVAWNGKDGSSADVPEGLYGARVLSNQSNEPNAANVAIVLDRTPPSIASTPAAVAPAVSPSSVIAGSNTIVTLTALATDPNAAGVSTNHYRVISAVYQLGGAPATGTAMAATDGAFNEQVEDLTAVIPGSTIAALAPGNHLLCVRATDAAGNAGGFGITGNPNCATLEITTSDAEPPTIDCSVPDQAIWYGNDVTVSCTASDEGSGLQNPADASFSLGTNVAVGTESAEAQTSTHNVCDSKGNCVIAGSYEFKVDKKAPEVSCGAADGVWHAADASIACTASDGGSGLANGADASFSLVTDVAVNTETANALTNSHDVLDGVGNTTTAGPISGNKVDKKAPVVACDAADSDWHASDVSIGCTATDGGSGLATAADESFTLVTSMPNNTETANAATNTHPVPDQVGNKTTAGPVMGNKVDKKGPAVVLTCPASPVLLNAPATASWTATDGGSGVASGYASGSFGVPTSSVGSKTATAAAGTSQDNVGNSSPASEPCGYSVAYAFSGFRTPVDNHGVLNGANAGQAIPLKWELRDYAGNPVTTLSSVNVTVASLTCNAGTTLDQIEEYAAGASGLQNHGDGSYQFNWKTPAGYSKSCKTMKLDLGEGSPRTALFEFKK